MSNILIIKHGSLGDIVQISGVLKDIRNHYKQDKITILTTRPYENLFKQCPYVDAVLVDQRRPRWNIFYLLDLKIIIEKGSFSQVIDLQNSSRTEFYRKYLFGIKNWSSTKTILKNGEQKKDFDQDGVLDRFKVQLDRTGISSNNTLIPDFTWAVDENFSINHLKKYIFIAPFSSFQLMHKRWPYYPELIQKIKWNFPEWDIVVAPGPGEIEEANKLNITVILDGDKPTNFSQLAKIIKRSELVIANDTGPAHIAAHIGAKGIVLFGNHTSPKKTSIETNSFKAIESEDLKNLSADTVFKEVESLLKN